MKYLDKALGRFKEQGLLEESAVTTIKTEFQETIDKAVQVETTNLLEESKELVREEIQGEATLREEAIMVEAEKYATAMVEEARIEAKAEITAEVKAEQDIILEAKTAEITAQLVEEQAKYVDGLATSYVDVIDNVIEESILPNVDVALIQEAVEQAGEKMKTKLTEENARVIGKLKTEIDEKDTAIDSLTKVVASLGGAKKAEQRTLNEEAAAAQLHREKRAKAKLQEEDRFDDDEDDSYGDGLSFDERDDSMEGYGIMDDDEETGLDYEDEDDEADALIKAHEAKQAAAEDDDEEIDVDPEDLKALGIELPEDDDDEVSIEIDEDDAYGEAEDKETEAVAKDFGSEISEWDALQGTIAELKNRKSLMNLQKKAIVRYKKSGNNTPIESEYIRVSNEDGTLKNIADFKKEIKEYTDKGGIISPSNLEVISVLATGTGSKDWMATEGNESVKELLDMLDSYTTADVISYGYANLAPDLEILDATYTVTRDGKKQDFTAVELLKMDYPSIADKIIDIAGKTPKEIIDGGPELIDVIKKVINFMNIRATSEKFVLGAKRGGQNAGTIRSQEQRDATNAKQKANAQAAGKRDRTAAMKDKIWGNVQDANAAKQAKEDIKKKFTKESFQRTEEAPIEESRRQRRQRQAAPTAKPKFDLTKFVEESVSELTAEEARSVKSQLSGNKASWIKDNISSVIQGVVEEGLKTKRGELVEESRKARRQRSKTLREESFAPEIKPTKQAENANNPYAIASSFL
jgi:hypothetical protein